MSARQYTGDLTGITLADQSDPWLQDADGVVLELAHVVEALAPGACQDCHGGFFAPTGNGPTEQGVQRCDACNLFDGDLAAAAALAALFGPGVTVWYEPAQVRVKVENTYADGHKSAHVVDVDPPTDGGDAALQDWWHDVVYEHTGDGHGATHPRLGHHYRATVLEAGDERLVAMTYEWF